LKKPTSRAPTGSSAFTSGSNKQANIRAKLESKQPQKISSPRFSLYENLRITADRFFVSTARAQTFEREFPLAENASIKIVNLYGRVSVSAAEKIKSGEDAPQEKAETAKAFLTAPNARETDIKIVSETKRLEIIVQPSETKSRIDLTMKIPGAVENQRRNFRRRGAH
jgi:hypothetical protein